MTNATNSPVTAAALAVDSSGVPIVDGSGLLGVLSEPAGHVHDTHFQRNQRRSPIRR